LIRYCVTREEVRESIEAQKPGWLERADLRTQEFISKKKYSEKAGIWSEVKPVFMALQQNKCVYCERLLTGEKYGKLEHDLEHFRPKSSVKSWSPKRPYSTATLSFGTPSSNGYYWLAYDPENYATSCKPCNSSLKSNYFPISKVRGRHPATVADLTVSEAPFLCYPIGKTDSDPEELVTFEGVLALPKAKSGSNWFRGRAIIEFFALNRDELTKERAQNIVVLGNFLQKVKDNIETDRFKELALRSMADSQPHAGCKRAFFDLWHRNQKEALLILDKAMDLTVS
jgi:hypothetical protein